MADLDKNIVIVPRTGVPDLLPTVAFTGFDDNTMTLEVADDGSLVFKTSTGQTLTLENALSTIVWEIENSIADLILSLNNDGDLSIIGTYSDYVGNLYSAIDEDDMVSNSATRVPTQQSVKAYVDTSVAAVPGTVASVSGTGTVNGITLSGTVTSTGNLTLGGTLSGVSLTSQVSGILPVANGGTNNAFFAVSGPATSTKTYTFPNASTTVLTTNAAVTVAQGGTGRATSTTAYGLLAAGTTATGAHQTLSAGATTAILVGGGASALPVWTTATGTGAPVRATSPTLVTPVLGAATATSVTETVAALSGTTPSISVAAGTILTWTLTGNSTPTDGLSDGQSVLLLIAANTGVYNVDWSFVDFWVSGSAGATPPTGDSSIYSLWKVGGNVYGVYVGVAN